MPNRPIRARELATVLLLVALFAVATHGIATRALWDIDEGMHAAMAREMVETGDWLTPQFNGQPFFDKPVLFVWLEALSMRLLGFTELAARLPGALLGLGTVLVTYVLGRRTFGPRAGLYGAITLATTGGFVLFSSVVAFDICLTFFVTLCLALLHRAMEEEHRRGTCVLLASAAAGLAFLTKGPVGVLLPALVVIPYLVLVGRLGLLWRMRLGWGVLVFLGVAAPWYLLMARQHPDYLRYFFLKQNFGYFASSVSRHARPAWFYLPVLLYLLAPWTFFLPAALAGVRPGRASAEGRTTLFLLCWALVIPAFFSIAQSKLPGYILPALPALAVLVGLAWSRLEQAPSKGIRRGFLAGSGLFFALAAGAVVFLLLRPPLSLKERHEIEPGPVVLSVGLLALALGISFALLLTRRSRASFAALALTVVGLFSAFTHVFAPRVDQSRSAKAFVPALERRFPPDQPLVCYGELAGNLDSAAFYTGRRVIELRGEPAIQAHMESDRRVFAMTTRRKLGELGAQRQLAYVVERGPFHMVVSNRPDHPGDPRGID